MIARFAALVPLLVALPAAPSGAVPPEVERFGLFETALEARGAYDNPYTGLEARAVLERPGGGRWTIPLFWDGERAWKLRVSPDAVGRWTWRAESPDPGLDGRSGSFDCVPSLRRGGIRPMTGYPRHFEYQDGSRMWFLGDTAWGLFHDVEKEGHFRPQAEHYLRTRAAQGFNAVHSMMLSEEGDGNRNGPPFFDLAAGKINPAYWREVEERIAFANAQGIIVGLAIAWGDKRKVEPWAWRRFPGLEARRRYARYVAARFSAYGVYFLVSGEWHGEVRTRPAAEEEVFREFVAIGRALDEADPHGRMIGIHPMTRKGSVREFAAAPWMSFGDYQQNYQRLHERVVASLGAGGPVVNSEYGYHLRDQDGDGRPDKDNSYSTDDIRHASWDIAMGGGYLVTGFGTTYFGGNRDPGPFDVDAAKNDDWEVQAGHLRRFFSGLEYWKLLPADALVRSPAPRAGDLETKTVRSGREVTELHPPPATYWAMTIPGEAYIVYVRGLSAPVTLELDSRAGRFRARQYDPREGKFTALGDREIAAEFEYRPPDARDWVLLLERAD